MCNAHFQLKIVGITSNKDASRMDICVCSLMIMLGILGSEVLFSYGASHNVAGCRSVRKYFKLSNTLLDKHVETIGDNPSLRSPRLHMPNQSGDQRFVCKLKVVSDLRV